MLPAMIHHVRTVMAVDVSTGMDSVSEFVYTTSPILVCNPLPTVLMLNSNF